MTLARRSFFHPMSGAVLLGVDWLCFGLEWPFGPAGIALMSLVAAGVTFTAVERIQRERHGDAPGVARAKAVAAAVAAGVPFPVTGTVVGGLILALSGLKR
ncbi:MAG: hypothetical protein SF051_10590 [Elusimicrobiota bacterium]|nr:hypothetical protein [Elusimicrobiota bacterium]